MQSCVAYVLVLFAFGRVGHAATLGQNPVSRIVELLEGLTKQTEQDGKNEEELYEGFVCWGKSVIDQKTATNTAANARISELQTYISDISAGKLEFTTERVDLEKELADIKADIQSMDAMRQKENSDFLSAEDEMTKAIAALDEAIQVMTDATKDNTGSVFAQLRAHAKAGASSFARDAKALGHAVELAQRVLTKGDAFFLKKVLTGDVPTHDWKKLNRKADFKSGYKSRSGKIQEMLKNMQATFSASLVDAQAKESAAQSTYDGLSFTKKSQEAATSDALNKMSGETAARDAAKQESQDEVDALTEQVTNDEKFIQQTTTQLAEKKEEWKDRQELRAAELEAFSKAIEILHSDEARQLMKRSFSSQGHFFLQEASSSTAKRQSSAAVSILRKTAKATGGNLRLNLLAMRLSGQSGSHFTEVITAMDNMIATLKSEENEDLQKKETCEKERAEDTRSAVLKARAIDDSTDKIAKLSSEIAAIQQEIGDKQASVAEVANQLQEATRNREDEHAEWEKSANDDAAAATTVGSARDVLANFYKDNNLMLLQAPEVVAGQAPPPPPNTFDTPYGGQTDQATGIIQLLEMTKEDIEQDAKKAKKSEDESQAEFNTFKSECDAQTLALNNDINTLTSTMGEKQGDVTDETSTRGNARADLAATMNMLRDAEPNCDFVTIQYVPRLQNRRIEIDGIRKAKAILEGAKFE